MADPSRFDIPKTLDEISEAVLVALAYKRYPLDKLDHLLETIDGIMSEPQNRKECENYLRSSGSNYVLFFLSNILYNLKQRGQLILTDEVMKWLGSVWKNFLRRNKSYQEIFPRIDRNRMLCRKYYPAGSTFVSQIDNVVLIKEDFTEDAESEDGALRQLEHFHQNVSEILNAMKPSYFFLLDYYYEKKMSTGLDSHDAVSLEAGGLMRFGVANYTYSEVAVLTCQVLGILEAAYLILKKKKSHRRLIGASGKQKFLTATEIYNMYLEKFNAMKKELTNLNR